MHSYNEFIYAISGGDMNHRVIAGSGGSVLYDNLSAAPPILHSGNNNEASFVDTLKKKLSVIVFWCVLFFICVFLFFLRSQAIRC